eukprot:Skav232169  [mRNA]  locus=scaffold4292:37479:45554:- [translate_table: standard]
MWRTLRRNSYTKWRMRCLHALQVGLVLSSEELLSADDECADSAESCALDALQVRGKRLASEHESHQARCKPVPPTKPW